MAVLTKSNFKSSKIKVEEIATGITVEYGDIFKLYFPDSVDIIEPLYFNEMYSGEVIDNLVTKTLDHIYKTVTTKDTKDTKTKRIKRNDNK